MRRHKLLILLFIYEKDSIVALISVGSTCLYIRSFLSKFILYISQEN